MIILTNDCSHANGHVIDGAEIEKFQYGVNIYKTALNLAGIPYIKGMTNSRIEGLLYEGILIPRAVLVSKNKARTINGIFIKFEIPFGTPLTVPIFQKGRTVPQMEYFVDWPKEIRVHCKRAKFKYTYNVYGGPYETTYFPRWRMQ